MPFALLKKWKVFHRFRCARALTLHTLARTRWRILRRPAPKLLPRKLSLVSPNDRTKQCTQLYDSIPLDIRPERVLCVYLAEPETAGGCVCMCVRACVVILNSLECFQELPHQNFIAQMHAIGGQCFCVAVFCHRPVAVFLHFVIKIKLWMEMRICGVRSHTHTNTHWCDIVEYTAKSKNQRNYFVECLLLLFMHHIYVYADVHIIFTHFPSTTKWTGWPHCTHTQYTYTLSSPTRHTNRSCWCCICFHVSHSTRFGFRHGMDP